MMMEHAIENPRAAVNRGTYRPRLQGQGVAQKQARVRARVVRRGVALAAIAIVLALVFVWTRVRVIQLGYDVSQINRQITELLRQKNQLDARVAKLKSLERLEAVAKEYFHMRLPAADEIIFVK